jgi:hypothetical protein
MNRNNWQISHTKPFITRPFARPRRTTHVPMPNPEFGETRMERRVGQFEIDITADQLAELADVADPRAAVVAAALQKLLREQANTQGFESPSGVLEPPDASPGGSGDAPDFEVGGEFGAAYLPVGRDE